MKSFLSITIFLFATLIVLQSSEAAKKKKDEPEEPVEYLITQEVWFDVAIKEMKDSEEAIRTERITIGVFGDIVPMTATNFVQLAKGTKRHGVNKNNIKNNLELIYFIYFFFLEKEIIYWITIPSNCPRFCYSRR
jgi:hypothetical protein